MNFNMRILTSMIANLRVSPITSPNILNSEAVAQRSYLKKVLLEIFRNSLENTCVRASFYVKLQVFSCEFCEITKNTFLQNIPEQLLL